MDAACTIQDSIHVFSLVRKYVSRILGTYQSDDSEDGASFLRAAALQAQDFIQPDCGAVSFSGSSKQDRKS